ncbi:hypothetical protein [Streptomyces rhizosphaericus]|uniref:hypothetical protein n=1 Tax=Streptomyces rhizosphaericus TaxID=114699 RepID=UPI001180A278|nr:hypothetical protein [Streptomyces rhizosphaericus]
MHLRISGEDIHAAVRYIVAAVLLAVVLTVPSSPLPAHADDKERSTTEKCDRKVKLKNGETLCFPHIKRTCGLPACDFLGDVAEGAKDTAKFVWDKASGAYDLVTNPIGYFGDKFARTSGKLLYELGGELDQ